MDAAHHVAAFVEGWARESDRVRREAAEWVSAYREWSNAKQIRPLDEITFLMHLARTPGVRKSRVRLRDSDGRVIKNGAGSPARGIFYELNGKLASSACAARGSTEIAPIVIANPLNAVLDCIERLANVVVANGGLEALRCRLQPILDNACGRERKRD